MYRSRKSSKKYNPTKTYKHLKAGKQTCPFCDINNREVLEQTKYNAVIRNIHQYQYWEFMKVTDHLMIIPLKHVESLHDLDNKAKIDLIDLIAKYESKGYNVYAREKDNSVKSVPHQHTHLIKTENRKASFVLYSRKPYFLFRKG